jgi:hypothetical protein
MDQLEKMAERKQKLKFKIFRNWLASQPASQPANVSV